MNESVFVLRGIVSFLTNRPIVYEKPFRRLAHLAHFIQVGSVFVVA